VNLTARNCILILLTALPFIGSITADGAQVSDCLRCHGKQDIISSGKGYLYIDPVKFEGTTHGLIGCPACHTSVTATHPTDGVRPSRASCTDCHAPIAGEYAKSLHANHAVCSECHNPHRARGLMAVSGRDINAQCAKCHPGTEIISSHSKWLPQAALHIDALPCITCHTGSRNYVITLYIEKRSEGKNPGDFNQGDYDLATADELLPLAGGKKIESLIDTNGDNTISIEELRTFNKDLHYQGMRLLGMMMPETITHSYQILENRWDCTFCHASGPKAMQKSYVAFPNKNGRYTKLAVEKGAVLDLLYGTPDFYMMGSTRSTPLSIIGGLIIVTGLMMPVCHGSLRFLTRKNRKEHE
jgi:hypothetical protein